MSTAGVPSGVDDPAPRRPSCVAVLAVVTLRDDGVVVADAAGSIRRPAVALDAVGDVSGAGDADPLGWGLAAASLAVETAETVPDGVSSDDVRARVVG